MDRDRGGRVRVGRKGRGAGGAGMGGLAIIPQYSFIFIAVLGKICFKKLPAVK